MNKIKSFEEGQVIKKDLRSRQSWIVVNVEGKLMVESIQTKACPVKEIIELDEDFIIIPNITDINF